MEPEIKAVETPEAKPEAKGDDLIARVSNFVNSNEKKVEETQGVKAEFDHSALDNITNAEEAKAYAENAYKSLQSGFNNKFQEMAELRKSLEASTNQPWTAQRVQELIQDPEFVAAAQSVAGQSETLTGEEYSSLTDTEKAQFDALNKKISILEQANNQAVQSQQDSQLKSKYANYDSEQVSELTQGLMSNQVQATREHLWKVIDYDNAVQRAYKMGLQDKQVDNTDKVNSMSVQGGNAVVSEKVPESNPKESSVEYFKRIAYDRLAKFKGGQQIRS